jgi:hypothetical protein
MSPPRMSEWEMRAGGTRGGGEHGLIGRTRIANRAGISSGCR